jgi:CMP-N-acetylneuraminic acid synthetase
MKFLCMIPARLGSQRLKQKNLLILNGKTLIDHAIDKAKLSNVFDEIWVNSENDTIGSIALNNGIGFHKRPVELANNEATSEDFVYEFLKNHECDFIIQLHSIAPLVTTKDIVNFVSFLQNNEFDILLGVENIQLECLFDGVPVNFNYQSKSNSQDLPPIQKICWSISAWRRTSYIEAYEENKCATFTGKVGFFPLNKFAAHVIKTEQDFQIAVALYNIANV